MEIEVEEYVRTKDGKIATFDRYSSRKETSIYKSPFNCFIKLPNRKTPLQCHRDYIVKHSKNIIDLIEVGDCVNGYKVISIDINAPNDCKECIELDRNNTYEYQWISRNEIKTILTKEQYMQNCYKIPEKSSGND